MELTCFWSLVWPLEELQFLPWQVLVFKFFPLLCILVITVSTCMGTEETGSADGSFKIVRTSTAWKMDSKFRLLTVSPLSAVSGDLPAVWSCVLLSGVQRRPAELPSVPGQHIPAHTPLPKLDPPRQCRHACPSPTVTFTYLCMTMKPLLCRVKKLLAGF